MSRKPSVSFEGHKQTYEYYAGRQSRPTVSRPASVLASMVLRPEVHITDAVQKHITELVDREARLLIVSSHISNLDPAAHLAMGHRAKAIRPIRDNVSIWAYDGLFSLERAPRAIKALAPLFRGLIDGIGAMPVYRPKDHADAVRELPGVAKELISATAQRMNGGMHALVYAEGGRNKAEPLVVQPFQGGINRLAREVDPSIELAALPIGHVHASDSLRHGWHIVIGEPVVPDLSSVNSFSAQMHPLVQAAVTQAHEFSQAA